MVLVFLYLVCMCKLIWNTQHQFDICLTKVCQYPALWRLLAYELQAYIRLWAAIIRVRAAYTPRMLGAIGVCTTHLPRTYCVKYARRSHGDFFSMFKIWWRTLRMPGAPRWLHCACLANPQRKWRSVCVCGVSTAYLLLFFVRRASAVASPASGTGALLTTGCGQIPKSFSSRWSRAMKMTVEVLFWAIARYCFRWSCKNVGRCYWHAASELNFLCMWAPFAIRPLTSWMLWPEYQII